MSKNGLNEIVQHRLQWKPYDKSDIPDVLLFETIVRYTRNETCIHTHKGLGL
jgi:hypothetical protein